MSFSSKKFNNVKKKYLKFIKTQEVLSEPFRDKINQLKNFYIPISKMIVKNYKKKQNYYYRTLWGTRLRKIHNLKYN